MKKDIITLNDLLFNFRNALRSLVPWIENINIPYNDGDAYDDWDHISEVLYEEMVLAPILHHIGIDHESCKTIKYGTFYENYKSLEFIVFQINNDASFFAFNYFSPNNNFDKLVGYRLSEDNIITTSEKKLIDCNNVIFYFKMRDGDIIKEIKI